MKKLAFILILLIVGSVVYSQTTPIRTYDKGTVSQTLTYAASMSLTTTGTETQYFITLGGAPTITYNLSMSRVNYGDKLDLIISTTTLRTITFSGYFYLITYQCKPGLVTVLRFTWDGSKWRLLKAGQTSETYETGIYSHDNKLTYYKADNVPIATTTYYPIATNNIFVWNFTSSVVGTAGMANVVTLDNTRATNGDQVTLYMNIPAAKTHDSLSITTTGGAATWLVMSSSGYYSANMWYMGSNYVLTNGPTRMKGN